MPFRHVHTIIPIGVLVSLTGCGLSTPSAASIPSLLPSAPPLTATTASTHTPTLILEPGAGVTPWVTLIEQAHTGLDLNAYLIDNPAIITALRQAGSRGVPGLTP